MGGSVRNKKPAGCVPTASSCVIWEGDDIPFLNLCKGDSINPVIKGIADKICALQSLLSVNNYDFSCVDDSDCGPKNFIELFQAVLNKMCASNTTTTSSSSSTAIEDYDVALATCFQSEGVTVKSLPDYLSQIGTFVCNQQAIIQTQTNAISQLSIKVTALEAQVELLING